MNVIDTAIEANNRVAKHQKQLGEELLEKLKRKSPRPPKPKHLTDEAERFWERYSPICFELGTLKTADVPSFTLLCELWQRKCECGTDQKSAIAFVCLTKQIESRMKAHGLTPESRKKLGIEEQHGPEVDEFGVPQ